MHEKLDHLRTTPDFANHPPSWSIVCRVRRPRPCISRITSQPSVIGGFNTSIIFIHIASIRVRVRVIWRGIRGGWGVAVRASIIIAWVDEMISPFPSTPIAIGPMIRRPAQIIMRVLTRWKNALGVGDSYQSCQLAGLSQRYKEVLTPRAVSCSRSCAADD